MFQEQGLLMVHLNSYMIYIWMEGLNKFYSVAKKLGLSQLPFCFHHTKLNFLVTQFDQDVLPYRTESIEAE